MQLLTLNAAGKPLAPLRALDPRRRRLSQVVGRHVDRSRPHMIAVQRRSDPLQLLDEAWVVRGKDRAGKVRPWPRRYLPADAIVVVVYLPRGGPGGGGASGQRKGFTSIALTLAAVALVAFAGPIAGAIGAAAGITSAFAIAAIQAGIVIGGTALLSLASRAKANKPATDTREIFGVSGGRQPAEAGGPHPARLRPQLDEAHLSQPDFSQYDGDNQILLKRQTLGLGRYRVYQIRAGKQVLWREGAGFVAPFDDRRNAVEFLYGTASTLVPSNVVAASGVGGQLPRPADHPSLAGPFHINQRGALVTRLQVDFQFPRGISSTATKGSGAVLANLPGHWSVLFEYAPIDEAGNVVGPWQTLYGGSSLSEGKIFATKPVRRTVFKDVPAGRYAVRGRNPLPDTSNGAKFTNIDGVQWDSACGWVGDVAIRPGITEIAMRIYATKGNQAAAFSEIEVDAAAIIPVWTGSAWVEQETSKAVWAYLDIMRNQTYGGAIPDDGLDLGAALGYAQRLTEYDTFDATIRGPVSVYEAAATVLLPMRAEPVHLGRYWSLVRDEPKSVRRHLITRRQITRGSTQIAFDLDTEAGAGHVIGEWDGDGDYRSPNQATVIYGEASLTPTRQRWTGVKSYAHGQHLTRWKAACGAYRRQTAPFGVEMEGRIYKRGDSISIDPWFVDVRKAAGVIESNGDILSLDADIRLVAGEMAVLRDRAGREWGPLEIAGQGGSPRQIVLSAASRQAIETATGLSLAQVLSDGRRDMTTIQVGRLEALQESYLIQSVRMDGATHAQVDALIDDPRVWTLLGLAPGNPHPSYGGIVEPESPALLGLTAIAVPAAAGFRLEYTITPGRGAKTFEVGLSYDGGTRFDTQDNAPMSGSVALNPVDPTTLRVRARAFGSSGVPGPYFLTTVALPSASVNVTLPPISYEGLEADVRARIENALTTAGDALDRALQSLTNDAANRAAIIAETNTRVSQDGALATRIDGVVARTDANAAAIISEQTVRTSADAALGQRIDTVVARTDANAAAVISEQTARTSADGALGQRIDTVSVRTDSALAGVVSEQQARIDGDNALAGLVNAVQARTDAGTATGRMTLSARSDVSGVSARFETLLATTVGGQTRGAGYYVDLMPDGSSRLVIEANSFFITSNGMTAPTFSFDGQTLTIPNLKVTGQAILPGAVTEVVSRVIENYDAGATTTDWKEIPGTGFSITPDADWPVLLSGTVILGVVAHGNANHASTTSLTIAVGIDGVPYGPSFAYATVSAGGRAPSTGTNDTPIIAGPAQFEILPKGLGRRISLLYALSVRGAGSGKIKFAQLKSSVSKR